MGRKIIIKNADFSANALEPGGIEWSQMAMVKPFILSNPANVDFGKLFDGSTGNVFYRKHARLSSTIEIPAGKKLYLKVKSTNSNEWVRFNTSSLEYRSAWSSDPTSALPATSIYFDLEDYRISYEFDNQGNSIVYFQASLAVIDVADLSVNNYVVYYVLV